MDFQLMFKYSDHFQYYRQSLVRCPFIFWLLLTIVCPAEHRHGGIFPMRRAGVSVEGSCFSRNGEFKPAATVN
jgi:hypothetical protein